MRLGALDISKIQKILGFKINTTINSKKEIFPGQKLEIKTKVISWSRGICKGHGQGIVEGELACEANMMITIPEIFTKYLPKK